jgi:preprotein translocase subunit SecD
MESEERGERAERRNVRQAAPSPRSSRSPRSSLILLVTATWACSSARKSAAPDWQRVPVAIELRLAERAPGPQLVAAPVYGQADTVYLHSKPQLSNGDIARVEAAKTMAGTGLVLSVWLTKAGSDRMAEVTSHNMGKKLAVLVNSVVVSVPTIQDTIRLGTKLPSQIGVPLGREESRQLALAVSKTWPVGR